MTVYIEGDDTVFVVLHSLTCYVTSKPSSDTTLL